MWRKRYEDELEPSTGGRPIERHNFSLIGILPQQVLELTNMFATADREALSQALREEAGHPWASKVFEEIWEVDKAEARKRGVFDLIWHRRAMEYDPIVNAPDFAGFDILLEAAEQVAPDLHRLLSFVNGNDALGPRRDEVPEWCRAWHEATGSKCGGWLDVEEVKQLCGDWPSVANPEIEEVCLSVMRVPYTHPGCWTLLSDLGGFFAQCATERRAVVVEVDL